ncbi:hypothetical protein ACT2X3_000745 [Enterobacter hormaechei]|uniref:hypothetical protein n=1 Tax=Enterobacter hormaechei TaxID=158836 RepID=UPI0007358DE2|nr:hypothetical protein [Enterobacter hormaechei]KTJ54407.1 hypothetical protein ASU82_20590 [Enterobacter hormaechei subsp. xiangfangensis]MCC9360924.1 hypothetical protein [Enterobacter hormaechei subsp. xiangfangensis]MCU2724067.1 hypothetical protein [Enterobacter hormaechei subsp. xiangfangensis]MCU2729496.1 hypothetical protein [Enterobacter hormaechei subsp. xiangfangensis]MCU3078526.1 hypothetical protein [Enterobacter hormaechei subsp. xiangfangensis]
MKKGQHPAYPCARIDTPRGMTYRQHLVCQLAPVLASQFFESSLWTDYDDLASSLMMMVDSIIEAEKETSR